MMAAMETPHVRQVAVGLAERHVTNDVHATIITYALGSCLGITLWDPERRIGGLMHLMLPDSNVNAERAASQPFMFVDTGVPRFFKEAYALGAEKSRLVVCVAGGATLGAPGESCFQIGQRNIAALRKLFWKNGVLIRGQDTGGRTPRTMSINVGNGEVTLKTDAGIKIMSQGN